MVTSLVPLAADVWAFEYDLRMLAGFYLPVRTTVLRFGDGGLLLWSPGPIDEPLAAALAALGEVRALVAPNCLHHLYVADAQRRYPAAVTYLAPGLAAKRSDLAGAEPLEPTPPPLRPILETLVIAGAPRLGEVVAFHRASASLLVTDLVFNLQGTRGVLTPWLLRLTGVHGRLAQSRLLRALFDDRQVAAASAEALLSWPFEQVIPAHGGVFGGDDVRARLRGALGWMLAGR